MRWLLSPLICLAWTGSSLAQTPPDREQLKLLQQQEKEAAEKQREIERSRAGAQKELDILRSQLVDMGQQTRTYEASVAELNRDLDALRIEKKQLETGIYSDRLALSKMLAALQRIERNPPPALLTTPGDASDAAAAAALLGTISKDLRTRAEVLTTRLNSLGTIVDAMTTKLTALGESEAELAERKNKVASLIKDKEKLTRKLSTDRDKEAERIKGLAAEAKDLEALIDQFENTVSEVRLQSVTRPKDGFPIPRIKPRPNLARQPFVPAVGVERFSDARGAVQAPVEGTVIGKYDKTFKGAKAKGLTLRTAPNAQVLSPFSGRVDFAGFYKGSGHVIILSVGEGYVMVMTGMGESFVKKGDMVLSGEPIGLMPFNAARGANAGPEFYIEIRKDRAPINPTPWLGTAFAN